MTHKIKIKLMKQNSAFPLWPMDPIQEIEWDQVGLSKKIVDDITLWSLLYDGTMYHERPGITNDRSIPDKIKFEKLGLRIWKALIEEIGQTYDITYHSILTDKLWEDPSLYQKYLEKVEKTGKPQKLGNQKQGLIKTNQKRSI